MGPPPQMDRSASVVGVALATRMVLMGIVLLMVMVVSPLPYDTSSTLVFRTSASNSTSLGLDRSIDKAWDPSFTTKLLSRLANWDALYFTSIATSGYSWEHYHAFLPGYPSTISASSYLLEKMGIPLARDDLVLLSGFLISNTAFVISALVLYRLSIWALRNEDTAYRAAILFCLTPANPFFFALYTESIFALASFCGMYAAFAASTHVPGPHRMFLKFLAALCFAGASYIRSNGIMLIGFFLYDAFLVTTQVIMDSRRSFWSKLSNFVAEAIQASLWSIIACAPFVNYLYSAYTSYCISETSRPWCSKVPPNIYSFVQEQYWNVGFLRYFRIHQLPNFLLAAPVIVISVSTCAKYLKSDWKRTFSLGVFETDKRASGLLSSRTFVFVAHLAALLITSVPIIHIQVLTRFLLSQCPVIYWFMAELLESRATWAPLKLAILTYCVAFSVIGVSLFSNFLPWT